TFGAGASLAEVKVGIVAVNYNSPTINRMVVTATEAARARGWTVEDFDGRGDQVATNNAAMGFIDRGFNAIINIASPNPQMIQVIDYAASRGVPFVSTFSGLAPGIVADIGSNNTADGVIAATEMIGRLEGRGHVVKFNWNVLPALRERDHGFKAAVADYPDLKITEIEVKVPGQVDDAYNQMTNLLLANTDIVAVWTGWDELVAPVVRAIEQAGMQDKIIVVSQDGIPEVFDMIRSGGPAKLTVAYDVDRMGSTAVDVVAAALEGKAPASKILTLAPCLVTQDTAPEQGGKPDFGNCMLFSGEGLAN
ncbi:MAG: sugar ABC transporter substrate-binding protein, partial [Gemmobacter sp.]